MEARTFLPHFPVFGPVTPLSGQSFGLTLGVHFCHSQSRAIQNQLTSQGLFTGNYIPFVSCIKYPKAAVIAQLRCHHLYFMTVCKVGGIIPHLMRKLRRAGGVSPLWVVSSSYVSARPGCQARPHSILQATLASRWCSRVSGLLERNSTRWVAHINNSFCSQPWRPEV